MRPHDHSNGLLEGKLFSQGILSVIAIVLANITSIWYFGAVSRYAYAALLLATLLFAAWDLVQLALILFLMSIFFVVAPDPVRQLPALPFLLPFLVSTCVILPFRATRQSLSWIRLGRLDRVSTLLLALTAGASTGALILWAMWTDNLGAAARMVQAIGDYPFWLVAGLGVPLFGLLNALAEEVVYRGVLQEALSRTIASRWMVLTLQAAAFAAVHVSAGFPNGIVGYGMVFVYGVALGYLRLRTQGMLAPYLAHVLADMTIGYFLIMKFM